jgi:hypothetical protein
LNQQYLLKKREQVSLQLAASLIIFQEKGVPITENLSGDAATSSRDESLLFWSVYENKA